MLQNKISHLLMLNRNGLIYNHIHSLNKNLPVIEVSKFHRYNKISYRFLME